MVVTSWHHATPTFNPQRLGGWRPHISGKDCTYQCRRKPRGSTSPASGQGIKLYIISSQSRRRDSCQNTELPSQGLIQTPPDFPPSPLIAVSPGGAPRIPTIPLPEDDTEMDPLYFCPLPGCEDGILVRKSEEADHILRHNEGRGGHTGNQDTEVRGSILTSNAILNYLVDSQVT